MAACPVTPHLLRPPVSPREQGRACLSPKPGAAGGTRRGRAITGWRTLTLLAVVMATAITIPAGATTTGITTSPTPRDIPAPAAWDEDTTAIAAPIGSPAASDARGLTVGEEFSANAKYVDPTTNHPWATSVTRAFDLPAQDWLPGHRGVDLELAVGESVLAAGDGVIAFSGAVAGTPVISIDHADGVRTTYQPVHSRVSEGDAVSAGEAIGYLGHPTDGWPGLHWGARVGEQYLNPLNLLTAPTIRLKPVDAPGGRPHGGAER